MDFVGCRSDGRLAVDGCARCPNSLLLSLSVAYGDGARSRSEQRGNVGARDSEWKKSAPIRGNK